MPVMALPRNETDGDRRTASPRTGGSETGFPYVDSRASASLSFGTHRAVQPPSSGHIPVPVGPGRTPPVSPPDRTGEGVSEFPLQAAKVQRPALRAETLHRDRLLDWLTSQADSRVILITAEAGYGKTTLLADFSRRTRRRVLWYRIDENDRSWVSVVRYLVAAGQEVDPAFGAGTRGLLERLGNADAPSRDQVVARLVDDFGGLAPSGGAILVLDDFHLVDDVAEIREVLNEFVGRAPVGLTIVIAGRRPPSLALAKLRSTGAVVELRTDDLRFDLAESEQLFRETYGRILDQDLLAEVAHHTDGWAACLQLVQSALRNRSSIERREFIDGLNGATGDLHDYLAEEVVGDLDSGVQQFLMRTSLLQSVYPRLAAVICEVDDIDGGRQVAEAERLGLLSRRSDAHGGGRRYHPLVQEFLEARLRRDFGDGEVVRLHRLIAHHAAGTDWRLAAHHFAAAGDIDDLHRLVEASVPSIMAGGDFAIAESFIDRLPDGRTRPVFDIVLSRMELARDRPQEAVRLAETAVAAQRLGGPGDRLEQALANLTAVYHQTGHLEESRVAATELCLIGKTAGLVAIGRAMVDLVESSVDGSLVDALATLRNMAGGRQAEGNLHYFGITQLNIGEIERARGNAEAALTSATSAIAALTSSSAGHDVPAARAIRAWALLHLGHRSDGLNELDLALRSEFEFVSDETRIETASILAEYVDADRARAVLAGLGSGSTLTRDLRDQWVATVAELDIADGHPDSALERLSVVDTDQPHRETAAKARLLTLRALSAALSRHPDAARYAEAAHLQATRQDAQRWGVQAEILVAAHEGPRELELVVREKGDEIAPWLSVLAEFFLSDLVGESVSIQTLLEHEVPERPERWRPGLRRALTTGNAYSQVRAAGLLDIVGEGTDIQLLRAFSKRNRSKAGAYDFGRVLARRLAHRVRVADLGRVRIEVGNRTVDGDSIRRKVLALLCLLITRPRMAATRDQVVESLWPEQDPSAASNSLNQTVYFLRRVFEPKYVEDLSPGYLRHESDLIWLDPELVTTESEECRAEIDTSHKSSSWASIDLVSRSYRGRFALDFEYEEWSADYRDNLHSAYLEVIERAISGEMLAARFDRAIELCRRALDVDPSSEPIERLLLRAYQVTGAHAAAEEQYRHYAAQIQNNLDIVAPPLDQI